MNEQEDLAVYFAEILAKQNATPEEKKIQALIKTALYGAHIDIFIDEVSRAFNGCGRVKVNTIKGVTEFLKANSEALIRNKKISEDDKERLNKEASNRLTEGEILVLGTLAHLGYLSE